MSSRLALGTAQFGQVYGIANRIGQVTEDSVREILATALSGGMRTLDTAIAYGNGERLLGQIGVSEHHVVTKLPSIPGECRDIEGLVRQMIEGSLNLLNIATLDTVLLHHPLQLLDPRGSEIYLALRSCQSEGLMKRIGYSVYSPEELDLLLAEYPADVVQLPFSVADRRFQRSGWLKRLHAAHTEVHSRSAFLQGLLLLPQNQRPEKFRFWNSFWNDWDAWVREAGVSPMHAAIAFVLSQPEIGKAIVGVESATQLSEILRASMTPLEVSPPDTLRCDDKMLINPSNWQKL